MKKLTLFMIGCCFALLTKANEPTSPTLNDGFSFGFQLNQFKEDFGMGVTISSPTIADAFAIRLRANYMNHEHLEINDDNTVGLQTWTPYSNVTLGLVGFSGFVGNHIKLYSEGGVIAILPSSEFSDESMVLGGYGLFGFELFSSDASSYFFEAGGIGSGATAEKVPGEPIYSNGFMMSVGFRYTLK